MVRNAIFALTFQNAEDHGQGDRPELRHHPAFALHLGLADGHARHDHRTPDDDAAAQLLPAICSPHKGHQAQRKLKEDLLIRSEGITFAAQKRVSEGLYEVPHSSL